MYIADNIVAKGCTPEAMRKELQKLSMSIGAVYNPLSFADVPFVAAALKLQLDGILSTMNKEQTEVYDSLIDVFVTVTIKRQDRGGHRDGR